MLIKDLLNPSRVLHALEGGSKKRTLELISQHIAQQTENLEEEDIFSGLIGREKLGSTGIGEGVAIPHCRLDEYDQVVGCLVKLTTPIEYDAIDGAPVDLLFVLLVPAEACDKHLQTLGNLAEMFSQEGFRQQLRNAPSAEALLEVATHYKAEN